MENKYIKKHFFTLCLSVLALLSITMNAQVGVETNDPKTKLEVNGALSLREGSLTLIEGVYNNNIDLGTDPYSFYSITGPTTVFAITGLIHKANADGQIVVIQNNTNAIMLIEHDNSFSEESNRIYISGEREQVVRGRYATVTLQYSATQNRWLVLNGIDHVETWYAYDQFGGPLRIARNSSRTFTIGTPGVTPDTGVISVNFQGNMDPFHSQHLVIEYVEVQTDQIIVRIKNRRTGRPYWTFFALAITINVD